MTAIYSTSWKDLGLEQPNLSLEEFQRIMGISIDEIKEIASAREKLAEFERARNKIDVEMDT